MKFLEQGLVDNKGEVVDEQEDIRSPVIVVLDDRELVDREPVVFLRLIEIDQPYPVAFDCAIGAPVLYLHAVHEHLTECPVVANERWGTGMQVFFQNCFLSICRDIRVEVCDCCCEPVFQDHVMPAVPFSVGFAGGNVRTEKGCVAELPESCEGVLFDMGFGKAGGGSHGDSFPECGAVVFFIVWL